MDFIWFVDIVDKQYPIAINLVKNLNFFEKNFDVYSVRLEK